MGEHSNVDRVEVYYAADGARWRAVAGNGEIVAEGESHRDRRDAERAALGVFPGARVVLVDDPGGEAT